MNFKENSKAVAALASISVVMSLIGCSTHKEFVSNKNIAVERIDSESAWITRASLYSTEKNKIILRGELKRQVNLRGQIPGHLHVELVNSKGRVFKKAEFNYRRKNSKSRISLFTIAIPIEPALISSMRVIHHDVELHSSDLTKSPWQSLNTNE